jgi:hypothetical protein
MKFITINSPCSALHIDYKENYIEETTNVKFLVLQIDNHLNWKNHIGLMISKLSGACYAFRSMVHLSDITTLKSIYFAYFHSIIKYGIIFRDNSSSNAKIFTLQEKIIRILSGAQPGTSCRSLFKKISCQYILSLQNLVVNNQEIFQTNSFYKFYFLAITYLSF